MGDLDAIAVSEVLDVVGQLLGMRHVRIVHQNRDDGDIAGESRSDFEPHEVVVVIEPATPIGAGDRSPLRSDDGQKNAATGDVVIDGFAEVEARSDSRDIHEDRIIAIGPHKIVEESARLTLRVVATVTDKDRMLHRGFILRQRTNQ